MQVNNWQYHEVYLLSLYRKNYLRKLCFIILHIKVISYNLPIPYVKRFMVTLPREKSIRVRPNKCNVDDIYTMHTYLYTCITDTTMRASWRSIKLASFTPFHLHCYSTYLYIFINWLSKIIIFII